MLLDPSLAHLQLTEAFSAFHLVGMHLRPIELKDVSKIALYSRLAVFCLQSVALIFIPNHENDGFKFRREIDSETIVDSIVNQFFGGFTSWDGQYFLHVVNNGYTHGNTIAFFPLFPLIVWSVSSAVHILTFPIVAFSSTTVVVGVCLNLYFFVKSAQAIYRLTPYYDDGLKHLSTLVVFLFCFNPASIFFSAFYSESLFAYLTFKLLLCLHEGKSFQAVPLASLSAICRSNGLLNFGFVFAFAIYNIFRLNQGIYIKIENIFQLMGTAGLCLIGLVPFLTFQAVCYWIICKAEYVFPEKIPEFCLSMGTQLPYSYIQSTNWNVGLFKYFEVKQLPNFFLAAPVLIALLSQCYQRLSSYVKYIFVEKNLNSIPCAVSCCHGIFLALFCFLSVHVQVSTRMILSSCPYVYVFIAKSIRKDTFRFRHEKNSTLKYSLGIYSWCLLYFTVGSVAFSRGYPWT